MPSIEIGFTVELQEQRHDQAKTQRRNDTFLFQQLSPL
jgi:hypothetical protein